MDNSDASIVGLQALRILHGDWTPMLLGSPYQTSTDAVVSAAWFAVLGASPLTLMVSTLASYLLLVWLAYSMLVRAVGAAKATMLASLLAITTCVVNLYALYPPRQTSLTLAFLSLWLLVNDDESSARRSRIRMFFAAAVAGFAVFADPYAAVACAPHAAVAASVVMSRRAARERAELAALYSIGLLVGLAPVIALWIDRGGPPAQLGMSLHGVVTRWHLLVHSCLPIALGFSFPAGKGPIPSGGSALHVACVVSALVAMGTSISAIFRARSRRVKSLALYSSVAVIVTLAAFTMSPCAVDANSYRYLVAASLSVPFLFTSLAEALDKKGLVLTVLPLLISFAAAGWHSYGHAVSGWHVVRDGDELRDEQLHVEQFLETHGAPYAMASYWEAYSMTFLADERIEVVPREPWLDRDPAARSRVLGQNKIGYIVDRRSGWDATALTKFWLDPLGVPADRMDIGRYTVVVLDRAALRAARLKAQ